jgi:hypothetical protein
MRVSLSLLVVLALISACGGGGGGGGSSNGGGNGSGGQTPVLNTLAITVDGSAGNVNQPMVTITVCAHGSGVCQTIDHVLLDTGSTGLRIMAQALSANLATAFAQQAGTLANCEQFIQAYSWGPVRQADITLGNEPVVTSAVQVMDDSFVPAAPALCTSNGSLQSFNSLSALGANAILGVGSYKEDCGSLCVNTAQNGFYYNCTARTCSPTTVALTSQLRNPVALLPTDNNGVIIDLPAVAAGGQASLTGTLIFGIGTQGNNGLGSASVYTLDANNDIKTTYKERVMTGSFIDSGSNGWFFDDAAILACGGANTGFYCPATTLALTAIITGMNGMQSPTIPFSVGNAAAMTNSVLPGLAGPSDGSSTSFDWGLPFFFGRRVYTAIEQMGAPGGTAPYVAF